MVLKQHQLRTTGLWHSMGTGLNAQRLINHFLFGLNREIIADLLFVAVGTRSAPCRPACAVYLWEFSTPATIAWTAYRRPLDGCRAWWSWYGAWLDAAPVKRCRPVSLFAEREETIPVRSLLSALFVGCTESEWRKCWWMSLFPIGLAPFLFWWIVFFNLLFSSGY